MLCCSTEDFTMKRMKDMKKKECSTEKIFLTGFTGCCSTEKKKKVREWCAIKKSTIDGRFNNYSLFIISYSLNTVLLIMAADTPAPKPLSILTTLMPGTHELSMAMSAVIPLRLTP